MRGINYLLKFKGLSITLVIALLILILSLKPQGAVVTNYIVSDKLLHMFAYCLLVTPISLEKIIPSLYVFVFALIFGGCIELIQPFTQREADILDLIANTAGISLGILIAKALRLIFKD